MNSPWFLTAGPAAAVIILLALGAAGGLAGAEWRRADGRRRGLRVSATLIAVGALALLALRPATRGGENRSVAAPEVSLALWTGGPRPTDETETLRDVSPAHRFRLPGADAPAWTPTVPDAGALRRRFPRDAATLHLLGAGLDAGTLAGLSPWRVFFHPGPERAEPRLVEVHAPRVIPAGAPWWVTGQARGGPSGQALRVALESPDGSLSSGSIAPDGTFGVLAPAIPAPGRFGWKLRLVGDADRVVEEENGGVSVVAPDLPRVLVLESSPHPDTAALRRWLAEAGGTVVTRTEVGRGRFRFSATGGEKSAEFAAVDGGLLRRFDVVLGDVTAFVNLSPPERGEIRRAVVDGGLGVLMWGEAPSPVAVANLSPEDRDFFLPWRLEPSGEENTPDAVTGRPVRVRWSDREGEELTPEVPVPVLPFRVGLKDGEDGGTVVLVRDGQGRPVVVRAGRGRGHVGLTLTTDTARWRREGAAGAFAGFWSDLLGELSAPLTSIVGGRWTLTGDASTGPAIWEDAPVNVVWQGGDGNTIPAPATVTAEDAPDGEPPVTLPLAQDVAEPSRWTARFWPRQAGWHRVSTPGGGAVLDFHVNAAGSWAGVRDAVRRRESARYAMLGQASPVSPGPTPPAASGSSRDSGLTAGVLFLVFVAATGVLWSDRRESSR